MIGGRVLDSSALTDAASGLSIYARALIRTAVDVGIVLAAAVGKPGRSSGQ
jgi:hypothetical protein